MRTENDFVFHKHTEDWGTLFYIMERSGLAFARAYTYNDDISHIYLDMLSVDVCARRNRIGTKLQEIREQIGRELGATKSCLFVEKNSWMHDWYKRRGYVYYAKKDRTTIWMEKSLL